MPGDSATYFNQAYLGTAIGYQGGGYLYDVTPGKDYMSQNGPVSDSLSLVSDLN